MSEGNRWAERYFTNTPTTSDNDAGSRFAGAPPPLRRKTPVPVEKLQGFLVRAEVRGKGGILLGAQYRVLVSGCPPGKAETLLAACTLGHNNYLLGDGSKVDDAVRKDLRDLVSAHGTSTLAEALLDGRVEEDIVHPKYGRVSAESDTVWFNAQLINKELQDLERAVDENRRTGKQIVCSLIYQTNEVRTALALRGVIPFAAGDYTHLAVDAKAAAAWTRNCDARSARRAEAASTREAKRVAAWVRSARKGKIPAVALKAGLYVACTGMSLAISAYKNSMWHFRGSEDKASKVILSVMQGKAPKEYVDKAWKQVKGWKKITPAKFHEFKRICSAVRGKGNAETKLACKMWAQSGEYTR